LTYILGGSLWFAGIVERLLKKNCSISHGRLCLTSEAIAPGVHDIGDTFVQSVKSHIISTRPFSALAYALSFVASVPGMFAK